MYSIGQVAELTGLSRHTLRLYEDAGFFVNPVRRDASGNRLYDADDVDWLHRCALLRDAGMPVAGIAAYVRLVRADAPDAERLALLQRHRAVVADELADAERRLALMDTKLALYRERVESGLSGPPWPEATFDAAAGSDRSG